MAIPKLEDDLAVISKLGEYPGSDDGLSTEEFKAKFDEAVLIIQKYLNKKLIPLLDKLIGETNVEKVFADVDKLLADNAKSNIKTYTSPAQFGCTADSTPTEIREALPNGSMFMCLPEELTNAAWNFPAEAGLLQMFKETPARVKILFLGKILEIGDYQAAVDNIGVPTGTWYKMPRMLTATVTLSAGSWANGEQTVNVPGVRAEEDGNAVIPSPAPASFLAYQEANVRISQQGNGTLTFICDETPTTALTVNILILR